MGDHLEEFNQILHDLYSTSLKQRVKSLIANKQINYERFCDLYNMHQHNLKDPLQDDIIKNIEDDIRQESFTKPKGVIGQLNSKKVTAINGSKLPPKSSVINQKSSAVMDQTTAGLDIFARLTQQKKEKVERKRLK